MIECNLEKIQLEEIHVWHTDCDGEDCEIREAIKKQVSNKELIAIAKEVDSELFDMSRDAFRHSGTELETR